MIFKREESCFEIEMEEVGELKWVLCDLQIHLTEKTMKNKNKKV
jgi:hypothetical protein